MWLKIKNVVFAYRCPHQHRCNVHLHSNAMFKVTEVFVPTNTSGVERVTHTEGDKWPPTALKCEVVLFSSMVEIETENRSFSCRGITFGAVLD